MLRLVALPETQALASLTPDGKRLFATRITRLFAYGLISVVLALYLAEVGFSDGAIGLLLSLTLAGDTVVSLIITTNADQVGRRRMLMIGAGLMIAAGVMFSITTGFVPLLLAAIIGTISPSGNEVGPFLPIEQAGLSETVDSKLRTSVFAWYNLAGSLATAAGALLAGAVVQVLRAAGTSDLTSFRAVFVAYAVLGVVMIGVFRTLSPAVETQVPPVGNRFGLGESRPVVLRLSALFALDAFGGGLIVQSLMAYWFHIRFGVDTAVLGAIFFGANVFAGFSALAAARLAAKIGLINTMVFTHIPSNILLMLVPLMPTLPLAVAVLLARFSISQMDVPTRQSYVMAVVAPSERSAAAGVTGIARTVGASFAPLLSGVLLGAGWLSAPFFAAGSLKIIYDLTLYRNFRATKPPEET